MHGDAKDQGCEVSFAGSDVQLCGISYGSGERGSAVVLLPDVHGVSPLYCEIAARFASAGLRTLLLDPYVREGTPRLADMAAVQSWIAELPDARVLDDVAHAVEYLRTPAGGRAKLVGIAGFCLGGQYALMAASRLDTLDACVAFYGMLRHARATDRKLPPPVDTAADLRCPVLGLFGAEDPLVPAADLAAFRDGASSSGRDAELRVFAGAGHAFVNDRRPGAYRPQAAADALADAIAFFRRRLSRPQRA
jgi:carboxymethylenebutenolidase